MGVFSVSLDVADPNGRRYETVEAMVDSGATSTVLPASMLEGLGVAPHSTRRFVLADGATSGKASEVPGYGRKLAT